MPTSATEDLGSGGTLLVFAVDGGWLLLDDASVTRGDGPPPQGVARTVLAVPGEDVAVHWLELAGDLSPAQAAGAARLLLADASAEPIGEMHVAVGRTERGLTPAALVPNLRMAEWLAGGLDPDAIMPTTMLLAPPETGFVRHGADHRGLAAAFTLEPELAEALTGGAPVVEMDEARFEAGLAPLLAAPPLNLRQGAFARRRQWRVDKGRTRRLVLLGLALILLSLIVQVATILAYTFAADRLETEAWALAGQASAPAPHAGFTAAAPLLFAAVRATPGAELGRLEYRADGSLTANVLADSPATFAALRGRIEASGARVEMGVPSNPGGRPSADFTVRPS